jgi:hypothetical protein
LQEYLIQEVNEGKTEFRISFHGKENFIIHPLNKDGKTIDLKIIN